MVDYEHDVKVSRYCPECGKRFTASESLFDAPRVCPACKTRVLFRDYGKEVPQAFRLADEDLLTRNAAVDKWLMILLPLSVLALLAFGLVALITRQLVGLFAISVVLLMAGIAGCALSLEILGKLKTMNLAYAEARRRLGTAEGQQMQYLSLYFGLKKNFDALLEEERQALKSVLQKDIDESAEIRQTLERDRAQFNELINREIEALQSKSESEVNAAKQQFDNERARLAKDANESVSMYERAASRMCDRYLSEVRKSIKSKLNANNFAQSQQRFNDAVMFCEKQGYPVPSDVVNAFLTELRQDFQEAVRSQLAREEQARIREQLREEQQAERELERELRRIEAEEKAIEKALADALERAHGQHSAEVEELRRRLADAEARAERTKSMAQLTKVGYVYVISNIGAFGEDVFKIGMTRRLDPMDRVHELGDASVPFPFDVHMMISSQDAPALESVLHKVFHNRRVNRVNFRKEFFKVSVNEIVKVVQEHCGQVEYIAEPEALQFRETQLMTEEEYKFLSSQVDPESLTED